MHCWRVLRAALLSLVALSTQASEKTGGQLWRENCATCHGADGRGAPAMKALGPFIDFTSIASEVKLDRASMLLAVRDGKPNTVMTGFRDKLSYPEIIQVVDYSRETFMAKSQAFSQFDKGRKLFERNCSVCHGDKGEGAIWAQAGLSPKPANFTDNSVKQKLDRNRMIFSISHGRPETAMTSWKKRLGDENIAEVVDYIRVVIMGVPRIDGYMGRPRGEGASASDSFLSGKDFNPEVDSVVAASTQTLPVESTLAHQADPFLSSAGYQPEDDPNLEESSDIYGGASHSHSAHQGAAVDINAPIPEELEGNFKQGKSLYEQTCINCHGELGNGQGPRAYFIFPKPRNFTHPAAVASFSRAHIFEQVRTGVNGTEMPAWKNVLTRQQMADVTEYVFGAFIAPNNPDVERN